MTSRTLYPLLFFCRFCSTIVPSIRTRYGWIDVRDSKQTNIILVEGLRMASVFRLLPFTCTVPRRLYRRKDCSFFSFPTTSGLVPFSDGAGPVLWDSAGYVKGPDSSLLSERVKMTLESFPERGAGSGSKLTWQRLCSRYFTSLPHHSDHRV